MYLPPINEVVFENRNKAYGAYYLRSIYLNHLIKAVSIALCIFLVPIVLLFFIQKWSQNKEIVYTVDVYKSDEFSLTEVNIPKIVSEKNKPSKKVENLETLPPVVKEEVKEEIKEKTVDKPIEKKSTENGNGNSANSSNGEVAELKSVSSDTTGNSLYSNEIFMRVELPAEFPGGVMAFSKFIGENISYPEYAKQNKIDGIIYIHTIVNNDGTLSEIKVYKGIEKSCDEEVLRLFQKSPKWIPARQKGKFVRQRLIIPIKFKSPN